MKPLFPTTMRSLLRTTSLLLLAVPACLADISTKLGFESAYVTYGTRYAAETWVPMIDFSQGDYYAGIWGYVPFQPSKSFEGEWDFFAGRTIKATKLVSFDVGATVYRYPRTEVDDTTLEGFVWLNFDTALSPKLKLYYDVTVDNWIGEIQLQHAIPLKPVANLVFSGHAGFRKPTHRAEWYYATAKIDLAFNIDPKTTLSIGTRITANTDQDAVGHRTISWYGACISRSW